MGNLIRLGAPGTTTSIKNPTLNDTLQVMCQKALEGRKTLRPFAEKITRELEPGDYNSEVLAIYGWVRRNIRYARDIIDVEYVKAPARLIETGQGDCDDIACLLASLLMAMGNECRFLVVGFEDRQPQHVFCQVAVPLPRSGPASLDGSTPKGAKGWVTVDPVADENTPQMHSRIQMARPFGITGPAGSVGGIHGVLHGAYGPGGVGGGHIGRGDAAGGTTFSIYNPTARCYDYYVGAGTSAHYGSRGTKYRAPIMGPQGSAQLGIVGFQPEALALPLPAGAQKVGRGAEARGIIAVRARRNVPLTSSASSSVNGLGGLGDADVTEVAVQPVGFGRVVAAACIASIVGVFVQKALR